MIERYSSHEIAEMLASYELHPWGEYRQDMMIAELCRCVMCDKAKQLPDHYAFTQFIKRPEKTQADLVNQFEAIVRGS